MPLTTEQTPNTSKVKVGKSLSHVRHASADIDSELPKFPRIEDCVHFHYETVDYGRLKVSLVEESADGLKINGAFNLEDFNPAFNVRISCKENISVVRRNLAHFETLDTWLHECVFDRKFSHLSILKANDLKSKNLDDIQFKLRSYLKCLSDIIHERGTEGQIYCAPVLHWLEITNHGRNLAPHALGDVADINIPAIAAARVIRRYQACDDDELSLDVGDMVSIIEMGAGGWWRGKQGFKVGSFPCMCVRRINSATDIVGTHERSFSASSNPGPSTQVTPIVRKHGKFMEFLRSFLDTRPSKAHLKKKGILRERVFGCDLSEILHRTNEEIPTVISDCMRYLEKYGIVDGIYRISGVASHIRHLKYEFDSDRRPDLENAIMDLPKLGNIPGMSREGNFKCDAHSVAGLCKLYFRELPNPLLTYQLYNRFASAVTDYDDEDRLLKVHDVIQQLPPPHYRTLKHLINHLRFMAQHDKKTSMHSRNLAIVWAPNLLRSREIEAGLAAFTEARVQSVVTEFLIVNGDLLFSEKLQTIQYDQEHKPPRPRSLMILPTPKLISLEEAQARSKSGVVTPVSHHSIPIESGISGVKLRNTSSKISSNENRKRHKKTTSNSGGLSSSSSHSVQSSKKQGHRHTASYSEILSTTPTLQPVTPPRNSGSNGGSGWKVKLSSLLRKPAAQSTKPSRAGSLRRSQSCDSLILSHNILGKNKIEDDSALTKPKLPINRRLSCEESSLSNRIYPEPQVPHQSSKQTHLKHCHLERLKSAEDVGGLGRCTSPYCYLDTNLPSVMDENGLDFDPLNYRIKNSVSSPEEKRTRNEDSDSDLCESDPNCQALLFPTRKGSKIMSAKLITVSNPQSSSSSSLLPGTSQQKRNRASSESAHSFSSIEKNPLIRDRNADPTPSGQDSANVCIANWSLNNNNRSRDRSRDQTLDVLTADSITATQSAAKTSRKSAVERLGVSKKSCVSAKLKAYSIPEAGNSFTPINNSLYDSNKPKVVVSQAPCSSRQVSVQFYDFSNKDYNPKKEHYGSFIALVGSNLQETSSDSELNAPAIKHHNRKLSENTVENLDFSNEADYQAAPHHRNVIATSSGINRERGLPQYDAHFRPVKLQTFSPDGKCRENYPNTPPVARSKFERQQVLPHYQGLPQHMGQRGNPDHRQLLNPRFPNCMEQIQSPPNWKSAFSRNVKPGKISDPHISFSLPSPGYDRSVFPGNEFSVPSNQFLYRSDVIPSAYLPAVAFENKTYVDPSLSHKVPFCPSNSQLHTSSGRRRYHKETRYSVPAPAIPRPDISSPHSSGRSYDNPSYELRPIYYRGQGRYSIPEGEKRPSLITSIHQNNTALSWV